MPLTTHSQLAMSWDSWQVEMYCVVSSTGACLSMLGCVLCSDLFVFTFPVAALLWFDWTVMFPLEMRRIWRRRFTGATVVYFLNRYTALFRRIFVILEALSWNRSDQR